MNITTEPIRDPEKLQRLFAYLTNQNPRNYVLAVTQLNTALRVSDIVTLKVSSFFHPSGAVREYVVLKEKKTNHERHITINAALRDTLKQYIRTNNLQYDNFLFVGKPGSNTPISRTQIHRIYQRAGHDLKLENFNSHSLRKTWGFNAYKKTKDIALIMRVYGHTSMTQTLKYIGVSQGDMDNLLKKIQFQCKKED